MTTYLGACTSGNPKESSYICEQPNSVYKAKRRAFSLKNSYINGILQQDGIILEADKIDYLSVEDYVSVQMKKYVGKTQVQILKILDPKIDYTTKPVPKNIGNMISDRVVGKAKDLIKDNDLFKKTKSIIKNIPVNDEMLPIERVSFRTLRLDEFEHDWEDSEWFALFNDFQLVTICYEVKDSSIKNGYRKYKKTKSFYFTEDDLGSAKKSYQKVQNAIRNKEVLYLPYPKTFRGQIIEVAPKGQKNDNCYKNFFINNITKVCFMLDKDFVHKKIKE
jgi:hypothetical protein